MTYEKYNRANVLAEVEKLIADLESHKNEMETKYYWGKCPQWMLRVRIRDVCERLSIFDWWKDNISLNQLKQMRNFLVTAGKLGFNGYVCFKVGTVGCANGMWANKNESTNGYSPDGEAIYHSFVSNENYWGYRTESGEWIREDDKYEFTLKEIKEQMKEARKKGAVA